MQDGYGLSGLVLDYAIIISLTLGAFILFFYLWHKKRLDFGEEVKYQMMEDDQ